MRKLILLIIVCFFHCAPKKNFTNSEQLSFKSIIENKKLNILYRGIQNPINVYFPNTDSVRVYGVGVHKAESNKYYITPGLGNELEVTIIGFKKGKEIIDKRKFRILDIKRPYTSILNNYGKVSLPKEKITKSSIKVIIPDFVLEIPDVISFHYKVNNQKSELNIGNKFNEQAIEIINSLKKGDSLLINRVKVLSDKNNICGPRFYDLKIYIQ